MRAEDFERFAALHAQRVRPLATRLLSTREGPLEAHEEAFLLEHLEHLGFLELSALLARAPKRDNARIVSALVERVPRTSGSDAVWHLLRLVRFIDSDAWADVTERLAPRLNTKEFVQLLRHVRGCALFETLASVADEGTFPSAGSMLSCRYDPLACRAIIVARVHKSDRAMALATLTELARCAPQLPRLDGALWVLLSEHAATLPLRTLLALRSAIDGVLPDKSLAELALDRARETDDPWCDPEETREPEVLSEALPEELLPAALERARHTHSGRELLTLLRWCLRKGLSRKQAVAFTLQRLRGPDAGEQELVALVRFLAEQLSSRSAWEECGEEVLYVHYDRWHWDALGRVVQLIELATASPEYGSVPLQRRQPAWCGALHEALAKVFLRLATDALARNEDEPAFRVLCALVHLAPPPRLARQVYLLSKHPNATERVVELATLNARFLRRGDDSHATIESVLTALHELHGAC